MQSAREQFLQRVRTAVLAGNQAGQTPALPERGRLGYQGAGPDLVARFCQELTQAGGLPYRCTSTAQLREQISTLLRSKQAKHVLVGQEPLIADLQLADLLHSLGLNVISTRQPTTTDVKPLFFQADVSITGVDYLIAETGSLVVCAKPEQPRSESLLPPVHIVVARASQLLPDLFDLYEKLDATQLPSCVSLITGPSKTGDIELKLVTGVHGPGEVHVLVFEE